MTDDLGVDYDASCPDCGHQHTANGCVGPQTESDRWAGVSPVVCDCGVWGGETHVTASDKTGGSDA